VDSLPPDWISAVTRPFNRNPELQLAARQELSEQAADADPDALATLAARFDAIDRGSSKNRALFRWLPIALAFGIALGFGIPTALKFFGLQQFITTMSRSTTKRAIANPTDQLRAELTPEQRLFVFGDSSQPTPELAARALWKTQPDNPVLFADYLEHCDPLPANFLETARRIDPDNGWFLLLKAGELAEDAVEKHNRPWSGPLEDRPKLVDWTINDEAKFQAAMALIEEAVSMPRIAPYAAGLLKKRLKILPAEHDFPSRIARLTFAAGSPSGTSFELLKASSIVSARAFILGRDKDAGALRALIPTAESLCRQLAGQDGSLVAQLVNLAICLSIHEQLVEACERSGLTGEANRLRPTLEALRSIRKKEDGWTDEETSQLRKHGDLLAALAVPAMGTLGVPPVTVEELEAGRRMNYAIADRVLLWSFAIHMLLAVGLALILPRLRGAVASRVGRRFAHLLGPADWAWILGLGTIAPLAWFLAISHLTPLGVRDWGLGFFPYQPIVTQYGITFYLLVFSNLCVTRWRLGRHASSLGFGTRRPWLSPLPVILLALALPCAGLLRFGSAVPLYFAAGLLSACALWAVFLAGRAVFGRRPHTPCRAAVATVLAPALAAATLVVLALVPFTHHAERHWIAKDDLMRTSPENLGMSRIEREACELIQARILSALDSKT
jgi:hypothetical protein